MGTHNYSKIVSASLKTALPCHKTNVVFLGALRKVDILVLMARVVSRILDRSSFLLTYLPKQQQLLLITNQNQSQWVSCNPIEESWLNYRVYRGRLQGEESLINLFNNHDNFVLMSNFLFFTLLSSISSEHIFLHQLYSCARLILNKLECHLKTSNQVIIVCPHQCAMPTLWILIVSNSRAWVCCSYIKLTLPLCMLEH